MTPDELAQTYVPLPLAWRYVVPGDVTMTRDGRLLAILSIGQQGGQLMPWAAGHARPVAVDPDAQVQVLVPVHARDAEQLTRTELGGRLVAARTTTTGAAA